MIRHLFFLTVLLFAVCFTAGAQSQYVSAFDYRTSALTPVAYIPGVHWVLEDNTAFDANHQRLFFQGGPIQQPPWNLYTVDVTTGAVLASPQVPAGNTAGSIVGLQYDNGVDTLYALYFDGSGGVYFSWVDHTTGTIHSKQSIAGFAGYQGSTYDSRDHYYIFYGGQQLVALDARTGNQVSSATFPIANMLDLVFDNTNATLYGISLSGTATFNSISLASAALQPIATLPVSAFPQINAYAIDEAAGNFIFVGTLPAVTSCVNYELYTLNIPSAAITGSSLYPYAQDPSDPLDSNLLEFSFDQTRGRLYGLNWRPTLQSVPPFFTISGANPTCPGQPDVFTATLTAPLTANNYQWQINSQPAGGNTPGYTDGSPADGDSIRCIVTASTVCGGILTDTSNVIVLTVSDTGYVGVHIGAPVDSVCAGAAVTFTATTQNGGPVPVFQWTVNGVPAGVDSPGFTTTGLQPGDRIACQVTGDAACIYPVPASSNVLQPVIVPVTYTSLTISASANNICSGDTVVFVATPVGGGAGPHFQWQINGQSVGAAGDTFTTPSLANGDTVGCILESSLPCASPAAAGNSLRMTVRPAPGLTMPSDTLIARGQVVRLTPVVTGDIMDYQWQPPTGLDDPAIADPLASPLYTTTYRLGVTADDGCSVSGKVTIRVYTPLSMPDAFTPNGDGRNDVFRIPPSVSIQLSRFCVYDRWGQRVFATTDVSAGWDGTVAGRRLPAGTYVWVVEYADAVTGKRLVGSGTVILIR